MQQKLIYIYSNKLGFDNVSVAIGLLRQLLCGATRVLAVYFNCTWVLSQEYSTLLATDMLIAALPAALPPALPPSHTSQHLTCCHSYVSCVQLDLLRTI